MWAYFEPGHLKLISSQRKQPGRSMDAVSPRKRQCALCQLSYGSGLSENIAASDVLRSRRMLLERRPPGDPELHEGIDLFLNELTRNSADAPKAGTMTLDVCAFCTQFLPVVRHASVVVDELRGHMMSGSSRSAAQHQSTSARRTTSNLVIQHQTPKKASLRRPRSSAFRLGEREFESTALSTALKPTPPPPTYRLLTNSMTRVLNIETPSAAIAAYQDGKSHLLPSDGTYDLRAQDRQQSAAFFRSARAKREQHVSRMAERIANEPPPEKTNMIQQLNSHAAAQSLYTGVSVVREPEGTNARAKIMTKKNGRHFKTELVLPAIDPRHH